MVAFDLQWKVIEMRRVDPQQSAACALARFVNEYEATGWEAEGDGNYGFVFIHRAGERMLLEITPRDPTDRGPQSFNPYK